MAGMTAVAKRARARACAVVAGAVAVAAAAGCSASSLPECVGTAAAAAAGASACPADVHRAPPSTASNSGRWRIVYRTPTKQTQLVGIASVRATDAWVVGYHEFPRARPIVLHWNGTAWRPAHLPAPRSFAPSVVMASVGGNVWIDGVNRVTGRAELFRFDGRSWRSMPVPPGRWSDNLAAVTGPAQSWLLSSGCRARGWPWNCSSTIEHWTGTRWIASHLRILVSGLAAAGSDIWAVGLTGKRPSHGGDGSGRVVLLRQTGGRLRRVAGPDATVPAASPAVVATGTELPQLAVGPGAAAWILCAQPGGKAGQGTLFRLNSAARDSAARDSAARNSAPRNTVRWTAIPIPAKVGSRPLGVTDTLSPDGRIGVWVGPAAHWTGLQWVSVGRIDGGQQGTIYLTAAAGIRGEPGSWAVGGSGAFIVQTPSGPGVITANGPLYR